MKKELAKRLIMIIGCFGILTVFLMSCYTQRKAGNDMVKAHVSYPGLSSFYCNMWYPIRWYDSTVVKYIQGETQYLYDTVEVDCDSIVKLSKNDKSNIVKIPCPPCPVRVDTFFKSIDKQGESTAALQAERYKTEQCRQELQAVVNAATEEAAKLKTWLIVTSIFGFYTLARWLVRIWGVKLP